MSPWVDIDRAAEQMGDAYVFSHKPNPASSPGRLEPGKRAGSCARS